MHQSIDSNQGDLIVAPRGYISVWSVDERTGEKVNLFSQPNTVMYTWAFPVIKALFHGDADYRLSAMYFEYENVATPVTTVTVPTFNRGEGLSYYTGLGANKDYLRVTLSGLPSITTESGYESYFTSGQGNIANCFAQTSGTAGMLGRPFSDANNSKVYGVGLLATPSWADETQDILFARAYFSVPNQQLKLSGSQIGVTWSIPLL